MHRSSQYDSQDDQARRSTLSDPGPPEPARFSEDPQTRGFDLALVCPYLRKSRERCAPRRCASHHLPFAPTAALGSPDGMTTDRVSWRRTSPFTRVRFARRVQGLVMCDFASDADGG